MIPLPPLLPSPAPKGFHWGSRERQDASGESRQACSSARRDQHMCGVSLVIQSCGGPHFFSATGGTSWIDSSGWTDASVPMCLWYGVTCQGNSITTIALHQNRLSGTLPASLGNLTALSDLSALAQLSILDLSSNQLNGTLPLSWSALAQLQELNLQSNALSGALPSSLGADGVPVPQQQPADRDPPVGMVGDVERQRTEPQGE